MTAMQIVGGTKGHIRYDTAFVSQVIVCACGWRDVCVSDKARRELVADHARRVHGWREPSRRVNR
jgi:hypothetical protein